MNIDLSYFVNIMIQAKNFMVFTKKILSFVYCRNKNNINNYITFYNNLQVIKSRGSQWARVAHLVEKIY